MFGDVRYRVQMVCGVGHRRVPRERSRPLGRGCRPRAWHGRDHPGRTARLALTRPLARRNRLDRELLAQPTWLVVLAYTAIALALLALLLALAFTLTAAADPCADSSLHSLEQCTMRAPQVSKHTLTHT